MFIIEGTIEKAIIIKKFTRNILFLYLTYEA